MPREITVASFNVHCGVDGWGRPFEVVDICRRLEADVLVLQENWAPNHGTSVADEVAGELAYRATAVPMARAVMFPPHGGPGWGPLLARRQGVGMRVLPPRRSAEVGARGLPPGRLGTTGIALLVRPPFADAPTEVIDLGRQGGDAVQRFALQVRLPSGGGELVVTGTHMSHLRHGSPLQLRRLASRLPAGEPAVLMGDMNLWGPPLSALLPGWSRAVRGRTWPAWRPAFQIDHVLVTAAVAVVESEVVGFPGSDHLPVRAVLALS